MRSNKTVKVLGAPRMERCIGCHSCSLACARLVHKRLSWDCAGIRVLSSGGLTTGFEARHCLACDPAPCVAACPTGAFTQRRGGGVIVRSRRCIRCGECARACPVDAVYLDHAGEPFTCIHCGRCVAFCPHRCLELEERTVVSVVAETAGVAADAGVAGDDGDGGVVADREGPADTGAGAEVPR